MAAMQVGTTPRRSRPVRGSGASAREARGWAIKLGRLVALVALVGGGCEKTTFTEPSERVFTPTPPPSLDLSGTWTGTETEGGRTDDDLCPPKTRDVSVTISQVGGAVSFTVPAGLCTRGDAMIFDGTLMGSSLGGQIQMAAGRDCVLHGGLGGPAQASHLELHGELRGSCNDVSVDLDLRR